MTVFFLLAAALAGLLTPDPPSFRASDFAVLSGGTWTGTLTYLDYTSKKEVTIRSNLTVRRLPGKAGVWTFAYEYPDEPKADGTDTIAAGDGRTFGGEQVISRDSARGGAVRIVTEKAGEDDGRKALFRYTYFIGPKEFSRTKGVRYEGADDFFRRSEYSWRR